MASSSVVIRTQPVTRNKLAQFLDNQELIRLLENLSHDVAVNIPTATDALQFVTEDGAAAVDLAQALAHMALVLAKAANEGPPPLPPAHLHDHMPPAIPAILPDIPEDLTARVSAIEANVAASLGDMRSAWTSYTPSVAPGSGAFTTLGTVAARYKIIGKTMLWSASIAITTNGTAAGSVAIGLPPGVLVNAAISNIVAGRENNVGGKMLQGIAGAGQSSVTVLNYDNTYPGVNGAGLFLSGAIEIN